MELDGEAINFVLVGHLRLSSVRFLSLTLA